MLWRAIFVFCADQNAYFSWRFKYMTPCTLSKPICSLPLGVIWASSLELTNSLCIHKQSGCSIPSRWMRPDVNFQKCERARCANLSNYLLHSNLCKFILSWKPKLVNSPTLFSVNKLGDNVTGAILCSLVVLVCIPVFMECSDLTYFLLSTFVHIPHARSRLGSYSKTY